MQRHRRLGRAEPAIRTPRRPVDAVVCDIGLPDGSGEDLFQTLLPTTTPPPFLFVTVRGTVAQAVRPIRSGTADEITKPFAMKGVLEKLLTVVRRFENRGLFEQTGVSLQARAVDRQPAEAAQSDAPLRIGGLPGLGKARLGRLIHAASDRRAAPILALDALRDPVDGVRLMRSLDEAGEGTLLTVGLGRLSGDAQDLLAGRWRGGAFRLIATAGMRLRERVLAGGFRADLFDQLSAHSIAVPPMAGRPEDALSLARRMFDQLNAGRRSGLAAATEAAIRAHDWPGNGREMHARVARAIEAAEGPLILSADMIPANAGLPGLRPLSEVREDAERGLIPAALDRTGGRWPRLRGYRRICARRCGKRCTSWAFEHHDRVRFS